MPPAGQLVNQRQGNTLLNANGHHDEAGRWNKAPLEEPLNVLITGFGPFSGILINPSWQAAKGLHGQIMSRRDGRLVRISCVEVPVVYEAVLDIIPKAHGLDLPQSQSQSQLQYDCFIHVGVSPSRPYVSLEKRARRFQYDKLDAVGQACRSAIDETQGRLIYGLVGPEWDSTGTKDDLGCSLDLEEMAARLRTAQQVDTRISTDAGLFLCEFTYYTSLASAQRAALETQQPPKPVLFVHVPNATEPQSIAYLTQIIANIISQIVEKL